jgi:DNA mismatch repair protein MutS
MGLFEEYEGYTVKYQKIYGQKTVVLYQNGSFFEVYGVDNEKEKVGLVKEISEILNIQMTRRSKAILENSRSNPLMAGFPTNQLDRYIVMLTEENSYVVIVVEQITPAPNPQRGVTRIIGPGTNLQSGNTCRSHANNNYLLCIYLESEGNKVKQVKPINMLTVGLAAIDVSTGQTVVYQVYNTIDDENHALDETYRTIQTLQPKEVIIYTRGTKMTQSELIMNLDLSSSLVHCYLNEVPPEYYKLAYQTEFLRKVFPQTGQLKPIEFLDMEQLPTALLSFIMLLNFCYNQNEMILKEIDRPLIWHNRNHLILDNNCINQLNVTSRENLKESSVFNLVDQTSTSMGQRYLKQQLLMPLIDPSQINLRYDYIEAFSQSLGPTLTISEDKKVKKLPSHDNYYQFQKYEPYLNQISDIERFQRKICLGILQPAEFSQLHASYHHVTEILKILKVETHPLLIQLMESNLLTDFEEYQMYYQKVINMKEVGKYNLGNVTGSFFNAGYNKEIDQIQCEITSAEQFLAQLAKYMSNYIVANSDSMVTWEKSNDDYYLEVTNARYNTFISRCTAPISFKAGTHNYSVDPKSFEVKKTPSGTKCKITSPQIRKISDQLTESHKKLLEKVVEVYRSFLSELYQLYSELMKKLTLLIASIDFYKSNAKTALLYGYSRPQIDLEAKVSYLNAKQIRHPLIERFQETQQYVPQDIGFDSELRGILLFGTNSCGKSSLMKALGLAVILAQSGLYVPASQFRYSPYKTILTRILGNDNIFKGLSSFTVEMGELRGILKRADCHSLVLGDEISHGTETISGTSIVASAIISLAQLGANFLFATHLHQLSQMTRITGLPQLKLFHLKVKYDETTGDLIYDRRLEEGSGHPIYGLEVVKGLGFDKNFLTLANEIRREIMGVTDDILPNKTSRYNSQIYINRCAIPECTSEAVDTHHIKFQSMANEQGFIGHLQKNHKSNLIPLCKSCHQMVHNDQPSEWRYNIQGYKMTTSGAQLDYAKVKNPVDFEPTIQDDCCQSHSPKADPIVLPPQLQFQSHKGPIPLKKIPLRLKLKS